MERPVPPRPAGNDCLPVGCAMRAPSRSSRGPGLQPFTLATRVRIPYGTPLRDKVANAGPWRGRFRNCALPDRGPAMRAAGGGCGSGIAQDAPFGAETPECFTTARPGRSFVPAARLPSSCRGAQSVPDIINPGSPISPTSCQWSASCPPGPTARVRRGRYPAGPDAPLPTGRTGRARGSASVCCRKPIW